MPIWLWLPIKRCIIFSLLFLNPHCLHVGVLLPFFDDNKFSQILSKMELRSAVNKKVLFNSKHLKMRLMRDLPLYYVPHSKGNHFRTQINLFESWYFEKLTENVQKFTKITGKIAFLWLFLICFANIYKICEQQFAFQSLCEWKKQRKISLLLPLLIHCLWIYIKVKINNKESLPCKSSPLKALISF